MVRFGTKEKPLILASGSPRRKEICEMLGLTIKVCPAKTEAPWDSHLSDTQAALRIAKGKAEEIAAKYPNEVVLASDTTVLAPVGDGWEVLGKPKDVDDAKRMLSLLSGKTHRVLTSVYVMAPWKQDGFVSENKVTFKNMSTKEMENYISTGEPMDKAGAYGIQGEGAKYIDKFEGDFYAVMGLPKDELVAFLEDFSKKV